METGSMPQFLGGGGGEWKIRADFFEMHPFVFRI
jgi:hypothetical protein